MTGIKVSDLQEGKIYKCRISGQNFMVVYGYNETMTQMGAIRSKNGKIAGKYFNPISGNFNEDDISDYQLSETE